MLAFLKRLNHFFAPQKLEAPTQLVAEETVSDETFNKYAYIISSRIQYFNELSLELKQRFVNRVNHFIRNKQFHYIGLEPKEEIPVLTAASAVQVTFGLKSYLMLHFKNIYILADAYRMDNDEELYIGHVAPEGIYLSWKHFLFGYSDNLDNINVAVHEMSHALLFNNYFAKYGVDKNFRANYEKFSTTTGPILADVITKRQSYLRNYALTNIHEFWAVSVEAFFENPTDLKLNMPQLYEALCRVLNQDPESSQKLLKPEL
ncbi:MAG TPA: zinc-dependent peptidase [Chitinophagaceae bacterium]|nr:zinc-dependent peptidase [Chitinophagaceae bacterium]